VGIIVENGDYFSDAASPREIELLFRNVGKLPNVAFFIWNEDDNTPVYVSKQLPDFYRMSMEQFLEKFSTNNEIASNMVGSDGERYLIATSAQGKYEVECRFYRADGTIFFAREVGEYIWDEQANRVRRSVGALIDLTALKETEQALQDSLEDLRAAQDRLVQTEKLASLGQLTAGIAHEIKNPLNFIGNFSALSIELVDELTDLLRTMPLDEKAKSEVDGIVHLLSSNLGKVVQHSKRADSIVKNMLLHSRDGKGDHRPTDINALVEESMNLAYHGARAESKNLNVTLQKALDPAAGEADLYPQEIMRVLLNLIGNGIYATAKRIEQEGAGYEPVLKASTKGLRDAVEITIRDNGTGIPPEALRNIFNPFFTTKPAGEGTGLGLSLSHDIVVKQHSGTIDVETIPGAFTEFRVVLPRKLTASNEKEIAR